MLSPKTMYIFNEQPENDRESKLRSHRNLIALKTKPE